ncbi:hypothetical protein [Bacteroides sp. 519]|uniref:hypothetical protein n=1 Tax=Bacteroides sp. 519 TaxID=2302937 RepID=UPI0013D5D00A|nr:hypothetical protein [Bacteroides sp. 519]NDV60526.1 hypothetical protein [Bacteroides sp. 519]
MKKLFLFLVLAVSFMACEGPMGPMGPMGPTGQDGQDGRDGYNGINGKDGKDGYGANWFSKTFVVQPHEWELHGDPDELNSFFFVDKKLPELTQEIYSDKTVIAYIQTGDDVKNGMPYVLHKGEVDDKGKEFIWTQTYDFDYSVGWVGFYLTYSDFSTRIKPTDATTFHIVLMW